MAEITVTDLRGSVCSLVAGDCFKAYVKGAKATMYQFLGLIHELEEDVYLVDVDHMMYMNVNRSWFKDRQIRKLRRANFYEAD